MALINFAQTINDRSGAPLMVANDRPAKLGDMCVQALDTVVGNERVDPLEKMARFHLANKLFNQSDVDLTAEEISLLRKRVDDVYPSPYLAGTLLEMLTI